MDLHIKQLEQLAKITEILTGFTLVICEDYRKGHVNIRETSEGYRMFFRNEEYDEVFTLAISKKKLVDPIKGFSYPQVR